MQAPEATLSELAASAALSGVTISPQGLEQRFSEGAAALLCGLLGAALHEVIGGAAQTTGLLARFAGVYLLDSTTVGLPATLQAQWPGVSTGQGEATAALKVQVRFEYRSGAIEHLSLQSARAQDRAAAAQRLLLPTGSLRLSDGGYFTLSVLRSYAEQGVYFLTRPAIHTQVLSSEGECCSLRTFIARYAQDGHLDCPIRLGKAEQLPCRLIAWPVAAESRARRQRQLKAQAHKQQRPVNPDAWALSGWGYCVTNLPPDLLSSEEARVLARLRWQIELLFKLWKSHARLGRSRSHKPWRVLCELYAKLLIVLIQHWFLLASCWRYPDRSLTKALKILRTFVVPLFLAMQQPAWLEPIAAQLQLSLERTCRIDKRRKRPASHQLLAQFP
jgi:hypothetical protein